MQCQWLLTQNKTKQASKTHSTFPFTVEASSRGATNRTHGLWPTISTAMMLVPQRGGSQRTECPEDSMLLWSTALLMALSVSHPSSSLGCVRILRGLPAPHWAVSLALIITVLDLSQALLLEQVNGSIFSLEENFEMWIVSNDHHPQKEFENKIVSEVTLRSFC